MIKALFALSAETILNQAIKADLDHALLLQPLHGKSLLIEITDWKLKILMLPIQDKIHVRINTDERADATMKAPLRPFIAFAKDANKPGAFQQHKLQVSGDLGTLQAYQTFFQQLNLDWEVFLASLIGNNAAAGIGKSLKKWMGWQKNVFHASCQDLTEYLQEEQRLLVGKEEIEDFYEELAQLRQDVDRLNAKLKTF